MTEDRELPAERPATLSWIRRVHGRFYFNHMLASMFINVDLMNEIILIDSQLHFCDASRYAPPNAFYNSFLTHQILIAHGIWKTKFWSEVSCHGKLSRHRIIFVPVESNIYWLIYFVRGTVSNLPFAWRERVYVTITSLK